MSITAGWLILAVLVVRVVLKKAPKWIICLFWGLVAVRLICPISIESMLSLIPSEETVKTVSVIEGEMQPYIPSIDSEITMVQDRINPSLQESFSYDRFESVAPLQVYTFVAGMIWCMGMFLLLAYAIVSQIRIRLMVREAVPFKAGIYVCDAVKSPFILGLVRPCIYIFSNMKKEEIPYVIAHERAHLRRKDHWWKPIAYLLLSVYWFHPLCWIAYILFCKDIEMACDESVIRDMEFAQKKEYSKALLSCSMQKKMVLAYPLAFGEVSVKERIQSVLRYKKASVWALVLGILVCIVVAVCFLTNPPAEDGEIDTMVMEESEESSEMDGNSEEREADMTEDDTDNSEAVEEVVSQSGPKGTISLEIPADWEYELCSENSGKLINGEYGINIYPKGVSKGYISIASVDSFGVCGTGLKEEKMTLAGYAANKGTFDNHAYWDFVAFNGKNEGIVAFTYEVESWWSEYEKQVWEILDTLQYSKAESESVSEIRLSEEEKREYEKKVQDTLGLEILLPESGWVEYVRYGEFGENVAQIVYYDSVLEADCTLRAIKGGTLELEEVEFDDLEEETWEGRTKGNEILYIKVQRSVDGKTARATWEYEDCAFAIEAALPELYTDKSYDVSSIPKTAISVIGHF